MPGLLAGAAVLRGFAVVVDAGAGGRLGLVVCEPLRVVFWADSAFADRAIRHSMRSLRMAKLFGFKIIEQK